MSSRPSSINNLTTNDTLITLLYAANILLPIFIAGTSTALSTWVIPMILTNPSSKSAIYQFNTTVARGGRFLQPLSRFLAASFAALILLVSQHPDQSVAAHWKYWAFGTVVLVSNAPYEIIAVFPVNDRVEALGKRNRDGDGDLSEIERKELVALLRSWQKWNMGRVALVFLAGVIALWTTFDTLANK